MPQPPSANMALILPTEASDTGVWGSLINAALGLVDQHDHSPGKGVKVPLATAATVTADVPWSSGGSFFSITNLKAVDFQPQATSAVTAYAGALFMNSANNELTWRSSGGNNVQLTSGSTLNISGVGGIGGDYISVAALADYTDASDTYAFRQQLGAGVRQYARVAHGDLDLFEYKPQPTAGVPTTRVRHKSPASLAASYDLTWLAALPASAQLMQVDNAGAITATNTITQPVTMSSTLGVFGVLTANSTSTFGGLITATLGLMVGNNANVTVQGTGLYKHGTRTVRWTPSLGDINQLSGTTIGTIGGSAGVVIPATCNGYIRGPSMLDNCHVTAVRINLSASATLDPLVTSLTPKTVPGAGGGTAYAALSASTPSATTSATSFTSTANTTFSPGTTVWVQVINTGGPTFTITSIDLVYDT